MALPATKKQRDPNDPVQILRTKKGPVKVNGKFWMVGTGVPKIIILTPEGGYRYARGGPIRSEKDLELIEPKADRDKALEWWANKDQWQDTAPRKIAFEQGTGYPIFEDTREYVEDPAVLQAYWPEGPILFAAMHALGNRLDAKVGQREPAVVYDKTLAPAPAASGATLTVAPTPVPEPQAKKTLFKKGKPWSKERMAKAQAAKAKGKAALDLAPAPAIE